MDNISSHNVFYNGLNITINIRRTMYVKTTYDHEELRVLEVTVEKPNGNTLYLGDFYGGLPKTLTEEEIYKLVEKLIDNIDYILYDSSRFIGVLTDGEIKDNKDITDALSIKNFNPREEELKNIYLEFLRFTSGTKEHNKYSHFLELYFNTKPVSDSIRGEYLKKRRKSILDYDDIDYEIKRDFSSNVYESTGASNYENNLRKLEALKEEIKALDIVITNLEELLKVEGGIVGKMSTNKAIKSKIAEIEQTLSESKPNLFDAKRRRLKVELKELKGRLLPINVNDEKLMLKSEALVRYPEIAPMIDIYSFKEIESATDEVYKSKCSERNNKVTEYNRIYGEVTYHEENVVDIEDLYDRVDKPFTKE